MKLFNIDKQLQYTKYEERCFNGVAPSFAKLNYTYGPNSAKIWLRLQLLDLMDNCGVKDKGDIDHLDMLADVIISNYRMINMTEFMVFCQRFKAGKYGKFYGVIDNLVITNALYLFQDYRTSMKNKMNQKEMSMKRENMIKEMEKNSITFEEYLKNKTNN